MTDEEINNAVVDVANAIGDDVSYLSAPGDRNFDSIDLLYAFASGVVVAYGTAVLSELGKLSAHGMVSIIKRVLACRRESQQAELDRIASAIEASRGQISELEIQLRIESFEQVLVESLNAMGMPTTLAASKATVVRQAITAVVKRGIEK